MSFHDFLKLSDICANSAHFTRDELLAIYTGCSEHSIGITGTGCNYSNIIQDILKQRPGTKKLTRVRYNRATGTYTYNFGEPSIIEGSVNPGRFDEDIFKGTCCIM